MRERKGGAETPRLFRSRAIRLGIQVAIQYRHGDIDFTALVAEHGRTCVIEIGTTLSPTSMRIFLLATASSKIPRIFQERSAFQPLWENSRPANWSSEDCDWDSTAGRLACMLFIVSAVLSRGRVMADL
jgi:hypothetical protein